MLDSISGRPRFTEDSSRDDKIKDVLKVARILGLFQLVTQCVNILNKDILATGRTERQLSKDRKLRIKKLYNVKAPADVTIITRGKI